MWVGEGSDKTGVDRKRLAWTYQYIYIPIVLNDENPRASTTKEGERGRPSTGAAALRESVLWPPHPPPRRC